MIHYNVNGITPAHEYTEWETIMQSMEDVQANLFSSNETKMDTKNSAVQHDIRQKSKYIDQRMKINMNSSNQTPQTRELVFKPGGTMLTTRGHGAGRMMSHKNDTRSDPLGQW